MRVILLSVLLLLLSTSLVLAESININTADAEHLETGLVGVGAEKAVAIVQYRDAHGPFSSVDDLTHVKGIGDKTIEKNREKLIVSE